MLYTRFTASSSCVFLFVCFSNLWFMSLRYLVHGLSWVWNHGDMQDIPLNVTSWILGQVYVRRHFLMPPQTIDSYNKRVMAVVCCEAQVGNIHFPNEVGCLGVLSWSRCARVQVDVVPHCTWPVETSWQDHVVLFSHSLWYYIVKMAGCNAQGLTEGHFSNRRRKVSSCIHWVSTSLSYLLSFLFHLNSNAHGMASRFYRLTNVIWLKDTMFLSLKSQNLFSK